MPPTETDLILNDKLAMEYKEGSKKSKRKH